MKGVQLSKMVQELNLHNKTPDVDISKKRITLPDINRPALQLTGYLEHFDYRICRIHISSAFIQRK